MIRPGRRTVSHLLAIALLGLVGLFLPARPARAMSCHVAEKPVLGISAESTTSFVVFNLGMHGALKPRPCSGEVPGIPSADTHSVAVGGEESPICAAIASPDPVPAEDPPLYSRLSSHDRDRPPRS